MAKQPEILWEKALASLADKDKLLVDPQKNLDKRTFLLDLTSVIEDKRQKCVDRGWKLHRRGGTVSVRELFGKMVAWINKFKGVGDIAMQYDPLHAALPWAAVRLVLEAVVNEYDINEALLESLEYVSSLIARYAMVEALYLNQVSVANDQLSEAIIRLYSAVLTYLAKANKFYSWNTSRRFMKSVIQPVELGVETHLKKVRAEEARVNDLARLLDADRFHQISSSIEQNLSQSILKWLDAIFTKEEYERALAARLAGTCNWVLSRQEFLTWTSATGTEDLTKILWIFGSAGFGKSILCARLINYLRTDLCKIVSFFFCSFTDNLKRQPQAILRSWVAQLILQQDSALDVVKRAYLGRQSSTATEQDLWLLFKQLATQVRDCVFVVDGYDECIAEDLDIKAHSTTDSRVAFLESLISSIKDSKSRILLVSRDDLDIDEQLVNAESSSKSYEISRLRVTKDDTRDDVMAFSTSGVEQRLPNKSRHVQNDLASEAAKRCEGMFLWVRLLHERLSPAKNAYQLRKMVSETPTGLEQAYERDLKAILNFPEEDKYRAVMILRWTLYAARPMTVHELTEALLIGLEDEDSVYPANHMPDAYDDFYITELRRLCGSLIDVRAPDHSSEIVDQKVNFVHFSVKEYLSESLDQHFPTFHGKNIAGSASNNDLLAQQCLHYLCYEKFKQNSPSTKESFDEKIEKCAFLRYAATLWKIHASRAKPLSSDTISLSNNLHDPSGSSYRLYSEVLCNGRFKNFTETLSHYGHEWPAPLYRATASGIVETVSYLLDQGVSIDAVGGARHTALQNAAFLGRVEIFELLLNRGADPFIRGGVYGSALNAAAGLEEGPADAAESMVAMLLTKGVDIEVRNAEGWTPLHYAASSGSTKVVQYLLDAGADINAVTFNKWTALHLACDNGHEQTVKLLLSRGANVALLVGNGDDLDNSLYPEATALHLAAVRGNEPVVEELLAHDADVDANGDLCSRTPSHFAAKYGHEGTLRLLHEKGANIEAANYDGWTMLHYAVRWNQANVVKWLLDHKVNMNAQDNQAFTSLCIAAEKGHVEIVNLLLDRGAEPSFQTSKGETALLIAAHNAHIEVVNMLLNHDVDPNIQDSEGWTALLFAARNGHIEVVNMLLNYDAELNIQNCLDKAALLFAAENGHLEVVNMLLNHGAKPNIQDIKGSTALLLAAHNGHLEVVNLLLDHGAEPNIQNNVGWTALMFAAHDDHIEVVNMLLNHDTEPNIQSGDGETALYFACENGHLEVVNALLNHDTDPNIQTSDGWTALIWAGQDGHNEIVNLLLDHNAGPNIQTSEGGTALLIAAQNGHSEVVNLLLNHDAEPNIQSSDGGTALYYAAQHGHIEVVNLLLNHGAEPNIQTSEHGATALYIAASHGHIEIVNSLLDQGADPSIRTKWEDTALDTAEQEGHEDVVEVLLRRAGDSASTNNETADSQSTSSRDGEDALPVPTNDDNKSVVRTTEEGVSAISTTNHGPSVVPPSDGGTIPDRTSNDDTEGVSTANGGAEVVPTVHDSTDTNSRNREEKGSKHRCIGRSIKGLFKNRH